MTTTRCVLACVLSLSILGAFRLAKGQPVQQSINGFTLRSVRFDDGQGHPDQTKAYPIIPAGWKLITIERIPDRPVRIPGTPTLIRPDQVRLWFQDATGKVSIMYGYGNDTETLVLERDVVQILGAVPVELPQ